MSSYEEYIEEGREHKECFGNYLDKDGNVCLNGGLGFCNYCEECREECVYV